MQAGQNYVSPSTARLAFPLILIIIITALSIIISSRFSSTEKLRAEIIHDDVPHANNTEQDSCQQHAELFSSIFRDLSAVEQFTRNDTLLMLDHFHQVLAENQTVMAHFVIRESVLYRIPQFSTQTYHNWLNDAADALHLSLALYGTTYDSEFILSISDWPRISKDAFQKPLPFLSKLNSISHFDIRVPAVEMLWTANGASTMSSYYDPNFPPATSNTSSSSLPHLPLWNEKTEKGAWRGTTFCYSDNAADCCRLILRGLAESHPDELDIRLTYAKKKKKKTHRRKKK